MKPRARSEWIEPAASSVYNALELRAEHPQARGLWLRAAWTWGHAIDDQWVEDVVEVIVRGIAP